MLEGQAEGAGGVFVGDWTCRCGQRYRVACDGAGVTLWPAIGAHEYRPEPVRGVCVRGCELHWFATGGVGKRSGDASQPTWEPEVSRTGPDGPGRLLAARE